MTRRVRTVEHDPGEGWIARNPLTGEEVWPDSRWRTREVAWSVAEQARRDARQAMTDRALLARAREVLVSAVEAIERGSTTAPVAECLRALLAEITAAEAGDRRGDLLSQAPFDIRDSSNIYAPCPSCLRDWGMGLVTLRGKLAVQCDPSCNYRGPEIDVSNGPSSAADKAAFDAWNSIPRPHPAPDDGWNAAIEAAANAVTEEMAAEARAAIDAALDYVLDLDRHGSIAHTAAFEIRLKVGRAKSALTPASGTQP